MLRKVAQNFTKNVSKRSMVNPNSPVMAWNEWDPLEEVSKISLSLIINDLLLFIIKEPLLKTHNLFMNFIKNFFNQAYKSDFNFQ